LAARKFGLNNCSAGMSALRQKADICSALDDVRFTPNSNRESGFPQTVMSALPPKATCAVQTGMSALGQKWTSSKLSLPRELSPSPQHNGLAQITLPYRAAIKLNDHAVGRINRALIPILDPDAARWRKPIQPGAR
jgi:hypothetical protein